MLFLGMVAGAAAAENAAATQTTLTVATDNAGPRTRATLTAHVSAVSARLPGVVNFRSGQTDLGSALVDSEGKASLQTDLLPAGSHPVVAIYQGQSAYLNSISSPSWSRQTYRPQQDSLWRPHLHRLSTAVGGFVSSNVTVTPVNGFNAFVSLSCTGLPINTTCTFTPG